jgi:hypothetical protein
MENKIINSFAILILILTMLSCKQSQDRINKTAEMIERAEKSKETLTQIEIDKMEIEMEELQKDLENNRINYSDQQIQQIGKLQGRFAAMLLKKGITDFQETVKDLGNQMEGFIDGISDSTNN